MKNKVNLAKRKKLQRNNSKRKVLSVFQFRDSVKLIHLETELEYLQALAYLTHLGAQEYSLKITSFLNLYLDKATNNKMVVNPQILYLGLLKVYLVFPQEYLLLKNRHLNI